MGIPFIRLPVMGSLLIARLTSRSGATDLTHRDRPLTREGLSRVVSNASSEGKHESRSEHYTCIPTIFLLGSLQREDSQSSSTY